MKRLLYTLFLLIAVVGFVKKSLAQQNDPMIVTGLIVAEDAKQPLVGANISIKGNKQGILTKEDGKFSIKAYKGQTIEISFVGYEKQEIKVKKTEDFSITLKPLSANVEEVVVVGYGTRKKSHLTGSVSKIATDEFIGEMPVSRADDALKGKLAGVNITTTDAQAGSAPTIQIRGATSITAGSQPLIVIDGYPVPTDLSAINMNDVESIEVLKDAASAAIYGSRGGNGVILITSKSGRAGTGRLSVNVNTGFKTVYRKLHFTTLEEWEDYVKKDNGGSLTPNITQADKFNAHTDAQDVIFRQVNYSNINIAASGGRADFRYYLSANAMLDNGVMLGNDHKKLGLRAGFNAKVNSKVTVDFGFTPSYTEVYNIPVTLQEALRELPTWMPVYHTDTTAKYTGMPKGSLTNPRDFNPLYNLNYSGVNISPGTGNGPLQQLNGTSDKTTTIRGINNFSVKVDFNKYLSFKSSCGLSYSESTRDFFQRSWAQAEAAIDGDAYARSTSKAILNKKRIMDLSNENIITYKRIFKKHDIDLIGGFTEQYTHTFTSDIQAGNFSTDNISSINAGVLQRWLSNVEEETLLSYLVRVNYAYNNKYLISLSDRVDGSSRFAPDNRYAFFPSISLGWKLSSEKFFPENKILNDVKLRLSYGATGNKNIGNYRYFANVSPIYTVLGNEATPSYQLTSFGNYKLTWERTFSTNFGVDMGFFNGKIRVGVDAYKTITDKLLLNLPVVASTGFTSYATNQGKVSNQGFELEISAPIITKTNFSWNVSANCYTNKNKLLDFGGINSQITDGDPKRDNYYLTKVGSPLVQYYGYQSDSAVRVHQTPNFPTNYWPVGVNSLHTFVKDKNKNGRIDDSDRVVLGNPYPKFNWGFTSNFQFKSFDVSFTFQGSEGAKVFNIDPYYFGTQYSTTGSLAFKNLDLYNAFQQSSVRPKTTTDRSLQSASFIALRNLNVGYIFSPKMIKKLKMTRFRVYVSSSNIWYKFAKDYSSYNPEADNGFPNDALRKGYQRGAPPLARTITFGANLDF